MARAKTRSSGGFTFAEHPGREAPDARIIWHANLDPGTIVVRAIPVKPADPDRIQLDRLMPWLTVAVDAHCREHIVLSDGRRHIRIDCSSGSLVTDAPVTLRYLLHGSVNAEPLILPLRRFLHLHRHRRFSPKLFPAENRIDRGIALLMVHDAVQAGATHRDIADVLFGRERVPPGRAWKSEALNSRIRRLAAEAHRMAKGAYRSLLIRNAGHRDDKPISD